MLDATATFALEAETHFYTGDPSFDSFYGQIRSFMAKDVSEFSCDGERIRGYRAPDTDLIWIRDHTHQMKAFKYWERDVKSAVECFLKRQKQDGSFLDHIDGSESGKRVPVEADVEYLLVEAAHQVWQATDDDEWLRRWLPTLERGLVYSMTHPDRWSTEFELIKRALTIDTWDFAYNPGGWRAKMELDDECPIGIMHGDNSGMFQACLTLANSFERFGDSEKAVWWKEKADHFQKRTNEVCWNGQFYTHNVLIDPASAAEVDQSAMLSLSNTFDINRGLASHEQAVSIIQEYQTRRAQLGDRCFAEWFSIAPCFPSGSFGAPIGWGKREGEYVNGGIMPLVGGELARAAFAHGFEEYGVDILRRYMDLIYTTGETYLWYWHDGSPGRSSPASLATDGWGASAMLAAFVEGLAGIKDLGKAFDSISLSPRWVIAGVNNAHVSVRYPACRAYFSYTYSHEPESEKMSIETSGTGTGGRCHVLLPSGARRVAVLANGQARDCTLCEVGESVYVDFSFRLGDFRLEISYRSK
ncbi:MAG: alpha,alpha-trehalase [Armatimonadetes bacterium]|nr:alpha,alpha-trehalase [Armatimonadota bacterium]